MTSANQPTKNDKLEESNYRLKLLEMRSNIIKSLAWPLLVLLFYIFNFGAINSTIREIPSKFSKSNKFAWAGLSFEITQKAEQQGIPELATLAKDLSAEEIEFILTTGNQYFSLAGTGIKPNEIFLDRKKIKILNTLSAKGLINLNIPMDEYLNYFKQNNIIDSSQSTNDVTNYILTDEQIKNNLRYIRSENYVLSTKGKRLFSLVVEVVAENIQKKDDA